MGNTNEQDTWMMGASSDPLKVALYVTHALYMGASSDPLKVALYVTLHVHCTCMSFLWGTFPLCSLMNEDHVAPGRITHGPLLLLLLSSPPPSLPPRTFFCFLKG